MQVLVGGRGVRLDRNTIVRAVKFYARELLTSSQYEDTRVYIDLYQKSQVRGGAGGIVVPNVNEPHGLIHIRLRTTQSAKNQLLTIAHEMVHLAQIVSGRFGRTTDRRGNAVLVWNKIVQRKGSNELEDTPWEIEARQLEILLYEKLMQV